jgi:hypothetical protein
MPFFVVYEGIGHRARLADEPIYGSCLLLGLVTQETETSKFFVRSIFIVF